VAEDQDAREAVNSVYRAESRRILATLIRLLGDFDLAEEAMHDAFALAIDAWSREGVPRNPRSWLISAGRFRGIDTLRRRSRSEVALVELLARAERSQAPDSDQSDHELEDDRLRLIFTCCHPALAPDAQIALTLREVCGLTTEEIARAYLTKPSAVAQRIVRAKSKIREARIPYQLPPPSDLDDRLDTALHTIYLVFNEGYSASSGESVTRRDLSAEAIRLARLVVELMPDPEGMGLLGLMLLQESRRAARASESGDIVLLDEQDRTLWDRGAITEGLSWVERAVKSRRFGPYTIQGAIASVHARAATPADTDWNQIVALYDVLLQADPSPVVELNRAAAIAMRGDLETGLGLVDEILNRGELTEYRFAHSARADLLRRLNRMQEAKTSYERALSLTRLHPERRLIARRIGSLAADKPKPNIDSSLS
jgi:RNA polymerase sigma-70 factor (ECF subfamily)